MRKLYLVVFLTSILALAVAACAASTASPYAPQMAAPEATATIQPTEPAIPTSTVSVSEEVIVPTSIAVIEVTPTSVPKSYSYGCMHTGFTFSGQQVASYDCDLESQMMTFTFDDGLTIKARLYTEPAIIYPGETVTPKITAIESSKSDGEQAICVIKDSSTMAVIDLTQPLQKNTNLWVECSFPSGRNMVMSYGIQVSRSSCRPEIVWESKTAADITISPDGGIYVANLAFPNYKGIYADFINPVSWTELKNLPQYSFTEAVGIIYRFDQTCDSGDLLRWETSSLEGYPTVIDNWITAGVLK